MKTWIWVQPIQSQIFLFLRAFLSAPCTFFLSFDQPLICPPETIETSFIAFPRHYYFRQLTISLLDSTQLKCIIIQLQFFIYNVYENYCILHNQCFFGFGVGGFKEEWAEQRLPTTIFTPSTPPSIPPIAFITPPLGWSTSALTGFSSFLGWLLQVKMDQAIISIFPK